MIGPNEERPDNKATDATETSHFSATHTGTEAGGGKQSPSKEFLSERGNG